MQNNVEYDTIWLQIGVSQYSDLPLCQYPHPKITTNKIVF